jgi:hypothetical protein
MHTDWATYSSRLRGTKSSSWFNGGRGAASTRRRSERGGRLGIVTSLSIAAGLGPLFNSAGEYRPTAGEPEGKGFRRTGDWTAEGAGWERKAAKEDMARAAKRGLAFGGDADACEVKGGARSRSDFVACIIKRLSSRSIA